MKFTRRSLIGSILALPFLSKVVIAKPVSIKHVQWSNDSTEIGLDCKDTRDLRYGTSLEGSFCEFTSYRQFKIDEKVEIHMYGEKKFSGRVVSVTATFHHQGLTIYKVYAEDHVMFANTRDRRYNDYYRS